jgi:hypothetical protein
MIPKCQGGGSRDCGLEIILGYIIVKAPPIPLPWLPAQPKTPTIVDLDKGRKLGKTKIGFCLCKICRSCVGT